MGDCCAFCFTDIRLTSASPDSAIQPECFSDYQMDHTVYSGKARGRVVTYYSPCGVHTCGPASSCYLDQKDPSEVLYLLPVAGILFSYPTHPCLHQWCWSGHGQELQFSRCKYHQQFDMVQPHSRCGQENIP